MNSDKLIATGLTEQQASAYALLIEQGEVPPAQAGITLGISRTNSYKLFDKLVELRLAQKKEVAKKIVYLPTHPQALNSLVAEQRNIAASREEAVRLVLGDLLAKYNSHSAQPVTEVVTGRTAVAQAYRNQILQSQPIYFLRSRMDVPVMGFDTMHEIRVMPGRLGSQRYGINPDIATGTTTDQERDKQSNLERTWVKDEDYTSPVEWSVSGSSLLIVLFGDEPHAITIENPIITEAFRQIWHMLITMVTEMPYYKDLPR